MFSELTGEDTADPVELTRAAHQLLTQIEDGTRYARAGLMLIT